MGTNPSLTTAYQFGRTEIGYRIFRSDRKHVRISVHPDRSVDVLAPFDVNDDAVADIVARRAPWIVDQLDFFLSFEPRYTLKQYVPGETHRYLGRQYQLRWIKIASDVSHTCALRGRFFEVECRTRGQIESVLKEWFVGKAVAQLPTFAKIWLAYFEEVYSVRPTTLSVRELPGRWGSCTPSGRVTLHPRLIHHRRAEIEYVIVHELCHLVVPNHGRKFMDLLRRTMPDYTERKERLERGI